MWKWLTVLAVTLVALPAHAQDPVPAPRPVESDTFIAGGKVTVSQPVAGDLFAAGGTITVDGDVAGDVVATGGNLRFTKPVHAAVYAMGGQVVLNAAVDRSVRLAGGNIEIGPDARIAGHATIGGGDVLVRGVVDGDLKVSAGKVVVNGPVGGNVDVTAGRLELGPNAQITGRLRYASREPLVRDPAAKVGGTVERTERGMGWPAPSNVREGVGRRGGWVWTFGLALLAAVLASALPAVTTRVASELRTHWGQSVLLGFVTLVCVPVVALMLLVSLIGAPLAVATVAAYFFLMLVGYVAAGVALGELALERYQPTHLGQAEWRVGAAVLGVLAVSVIGRIPGLGAVVVMGALVTGVGLLLLSARKPAAMAA